MPCQFFKKSLSRRISGVFALKKPCARWVCRFGLIIELIIDIITTMQPALSRYQRTRLRVKEKRSQWKESLYKAGDLTAFMLRFFREAVKPPYEWREIFYQCYLVCYKSTFLICLTGLIQ